MEDEIPDAKCKEMYCEVCRHNIKKLGWAKHLKTKKHRENEKGVEEVEKKQCWKCRCWRVLELYRGENATCNVCLGYRESWAKKNEEKVREMNRNYWDKHKEEKREYNKEYSQSEIECEVCECKVRKCNWARHLGSKKHMLGGGGGKVDGDVGEKIGRRLGLGHTEVLGLSAPHSLPQILSQKNFSSPSASFSQYFMCPACSFSIYITPNVLRCLIHYFM